MPKCRVNFGNMKKAVEMLKKDKILRCQEIMYSTAIGKNVPYLDLIFLLDLFEGHSDWGNKKGVGVSGIRIQMNPYKTRCFILERQDGSETDISFMKSITNPSKKQGVRKACRDAIRNEIVKFRDDNVDFGITRCPVSGDILTKSNTHIDHFDLTFNDLFNVWIADKSIDTLYRKLIPKADNMYSRPFSDEDIITDFVKFHNSNTHLRAVSALANLSTIKTQ